MLKRMQHKFILVTMISVALVMILIIIGINLTSYFRMQNRQDEKLNGIYEYEQMYDEDQNLKKPPISEMPWAEGEGKEFTTRFFVVHCDREGNLKVFGNEYITSIDEETAEEYTKTILEKRKPGGYYQDYRFIVKQEDDDLVIIFLNVSDEMRSIKNFAIASLLVGLVGLLMVLALLVLLSGRVVRPYVRNIERQKQFITDAGHELKTPITSISTSADIAAMKYDGDEWIENIQEQTARLTSLTQELVALSELDEEAPHINKSEFSLSELVKETLDSFEARITADNKSCTIDIDDGIKYTGDSAQIERMLSILLDNAIRYSPPLGRIGFKLYRAKEIYLEISNSCVIDANMDLDRIFDRFYRPDSSRSAQTGGSGLGLSIAKRIAELHGGDITVTTANGERITFIVSL